MKFLAMHITNQKLSFDIFTVGILQNIFMEHDLYLKRSYDVAKKNIILCIWCNAMCLCGLRLKKTLFSTYCTLLLLLYAPPFWNTEIHFYKAHCSEKRGVLWLASYPVRCDWPNTSSVRRKCYAPLPYCDAVSWRDDTKTIKPIINKAFVASSWDIYWL